MPGKPSKKRSGKATSSAPRSDATFFVDRSLGRRAVPDALRQADFHVVVHDDVFPQDTPDEQWLEHCGRERWIVLSADKSIRRKPNEIDAMKRNKVRAVFLTSGNLTAAEQAELLARCGRKIQDHAMSAAPPAAFSLTKDGTLTRLDL